MTGVDAASKEDAGLASVQIGRPEEELAGTVAVAVAPSLVEVALATLIAGTREVNDLIGAARYAIAIDEELLAVMGKPFCGAFALGLAKVSP